jgi:hypothetical protein
MIQPGRWGRWADKEDEHHGLQEEYIREQIDWREISFADNQPCINLISLKPYGILRILDDQCCFPQVSSTPPAPVLIWSESFVPLCCGLGQAVGCWTPILPFSLRLDGGCRCPEEGLHQPGKSRRDFWKR